jgi:hypothetical protein
LGFSAEARRDDVGVGGWVIGDLQHGVSRCAGLASDVFEHQDAGAEQRARAL